jgi:hypothetical protein
MKKKIKFIIFVTEKLILCIVFIVYTKSLNPVFFTSSSLILLLGNQNYWYPYAVLGQLRFVDDSLMQKAVNMRQHGRKQIEKRRDFKSLCNFGTFCVNENIIIIIMSRVLVTIDGFWIGLDLLDLIHSHSSGLQAIQRYRYSTHFQFTVTQALGFSVYFHESLLGNSSPQWLFLCNVCIRRFLVTNLSNGDSSPSVARSLTLHSRAEQSRAEAYCRQSAGTVTPGIGPRWDPWPYICWMPRPLCFSFLLR